MSLRSGKKYTSENVPPATQQGREKSPSVQQEETRSHVSRASRSSKLSSASSLAVRARAKAEAARVQLAFAEKEAIMLREKAELDAKLHILKLQSVAAAAAAEAAAYVEEDTSGSEITQGPTVPEKPISSVERTSDYVQKVISIKAKGQSPKTEPAEFSPKPAEASSAPSQLNDIKSTRLVKEPPLEYLKKENQGVSLSWPKDYMSEQQNVHDITRYLIRKEMVNSSFSKFDDCPENYWAWKSSFLSAVRDLNLSASEILDLMIKWLGTESAQHAKSMRRVHLFHPSAGLDMAWQRLEERYGSPEVIEGAFLKKLKDFPKLNNKDNARLQELGDLLLEIECAKEEGFLPGLAYLDTAQGINPVAEKLPYPLQVKWTSVGAKYKEENRVSFPPFFVFSRFVQQQAKIRCDPSFAFISSGNQLTKSETASRPHSKTHVSTNKTTVPPTATDYQNSFKATPIENLDNECPIHHKPHPLKSCNVFRRKPIKERMSFLKQNGICFKCCETTKHIAKDCKTAVGCSECGSVTHIAALHPDLPVSTTETIEARKDQGREQKESSLSPIVTTCTEVCGQGKSSRSCSKICLVTVYPSGRREKATKMYAVLDEQSNRSLARSEFFDIFNIKTTAAPYTLKTCAGTMETAGRSATDFIVESFDGKKRLPLPTLIECDMIPEDRSEIPSPEVVRHHPHLHSIAHLIPVIDPDAPMLLLLGRDVLQAHKVRQQINGSSSAPYAQRLDLGWVVVGDVCLGSTHKPDRVCTLKTSVLANGRASFFSPCPSSFIVKENFGSLAQPGDFPSVSTKEDTFFNIETDNLGASVFRRSEEDEKPALSIEDQVFLQIMDRETYQDDNDCWVAPLPFRKPRSRLPCNREQAMKRLHSLRRTLQRKPEVKEDFTEFIKRMLENNHAEVAGPLEQDKEHWYLPMFGVYHPHKPGQIRVVFDSSAECEGVSLNSVLLSGPDLNNTLLGVLMRFRKELIAFTADVQQMFYCFLVREDHRDYLRFLWYKDHDIDKEVVEYRMRVHVFGNSPSPAVSIYCMRKAALKGVERYGQEAKVFVWRHFYVDDGLASARTPEIAINILNKTQQMLAGSNLRLHKIASNNTQVMEAFPAEDRAKDLKDLCLRTDALPLQKSLGLSWDLETDSFVFQVSLEEKPFTRRGILSTMNSLYDPLGFVAPVTIKGKVLVRELSSGKCEWDAPLPQEKLHEWIQWKESLQALKHLKMARCYAPMSLSEACRKELNICASHAGVQDYLQDRGCTWIFNPPHSSHMGGAWERLIGVARHILDAMLLQDKSVRLTHEALSTFMSEVMAIINARPLVPVSTDPDNPLVLTPAMLLTQKTNSLAAPSGNFEKAELHVKQWKQVQCLADTFWKRWRREYLCTLQTRRKWTQDCPNVKVGDVVLLKDSQENRNDWPVGVIINTLPSRDGKVRKVEVRVVKQETAKVYVRPVSDIVVLVSEE